jgi:hypothetical protein
MRDVGTAVRKAIFTAINGNVLWEGAPVPVVDEKLDRLISETDLYILIDTQSETQLNVKCHYATSVNLTLRIVQKRQATNSKTVVENVVNQIMQILKPTKIATGFTLPDPFKLSLFTISSAEYQFSAEQGGFQIWKLISTTTRLTHE